jgi:flagellin-like hook-associated protein FlgL
MLNIGRVSTGQKFAGAKDSILRNQLAFSKSSLQMNTGQRVLNNYSQYGGTRDLAQITGRLSQKTQQVENYQFASTELGLAETALNNMKDLLDNIKVDALQASNDTYGPGDLEILGDQLRNIGENVYLISNTKLGDKFIFGGLQSDKKVIDFSSGDLFGNAVYKEGFAELGTRETEGIQSSVSLQNIFNTNAASAQIQGNAFVTPLLAGGQINLTVNDGTQDIYVGDITFGVGDTIPIIVGNINAAFTAAGGTGTIVQDGGGFLDFDTALVTGNVENESAAIIISDGLTMPGTTNILGLGVSSATGVSKDLRQTLGELDSAYYSGDNQRVRNSLADLQANIDRLVATISEIGNLNKQFDEQVDRESFNKEAMQIQQADIAQIPVAEAAQNLNEAQTILGYTMQFSSRIMQQNIFDFI